MIQYSGQHSVTFGVKNTWTDWHIIPLSRPVFLPPPLRVKDIDRVNMDGFVDLSSILSATPLFGNREGSLEFVVANDYLSWSSTYSMIMNYLHGMRMRAVLSDDPRFYYEGLFEVSEWASNSYFSTITIDYNLDPEKKVV